MEVDGQDRTERQSMEVGIVSGYEYNCRQSNPTLDSITSLDSTHKNFTIDEFILSPIQPLRRPRA